MELTTRLHLLLTFMYVQFYFICLYGTDVEDFTTAINCTETFMGLTDSSEVQYQGECIRAFFMLLHLASLFLHLYLLRKAQQY